MNNSKKKKIITATVATTLTAAVLLAGTYAWQNLNQEALNVASDVANPGGRLHDDFNGRNKDVYVENFSDLPIYARIQLTEYMEKGENAGINLEDTVENRGVSLITEEADYNDKATWPVHYFETEKNETDAYWTWSYGGKTIYMPTFNMNQDSLEPEINGTYEGSDPTDNIHYDDYVVYIENETVTDYEISDFDENAIDEGAEAVESVNILMSTEEITHTAKPTDTASVISMEEWNNLSEEEKEAAYWVYDTDGWVYYSKPIEAKTATGLLLDQIELTGVVGESWYYAINVVAQFVTADDVGFDDNTGFYDVTKGTVPTEDAENLLAEIGVDFTETVEPVVIPLSLPEDFVSVGDDSSDHPSVVVTLGEGWTNADVEWYLDIGSGATLRAEVVPGEADSNTATVQHIGGACAGGGTYTLTVTALDGSASGSIDILFDC